MLEFSMTIKCGNCITYDHYNFNKSDDGQPYSFAEIINTKGYGKFTAVQKKPNEIMLMCKSCHHEEEFCL